MIVYDLSCSSGHRFEGWFASSGDFAAQRERGLVTCPQCGSAEVAKAPMAPAVPRKGNQQAGTPQPAGEEADGHTNLTRGELSPEVENALRKLAEAQKKALENSTWVGDTFAEKSRAMHYGDEDTASIHGRASLEEAAELIEEGIKVAALPFPISPPDELN